jgi:hypothetical protein
VPLSSGVAPPLPFSPVRFSGLMDRVLASDKRGRLPIFMLKPSKPLPKVLAAAAMTRAIAQKLSFQFLSHVFIDNPQKNLLKTGITKFRNILNIIIDTKQDMSTLKDILSSRPCLRSKIAGDGNFQPSFLGKEFSRPFKRLFIKSSML